MRTKIILLWLFCRLFFPAVTQAQFFKGVGVMAGPGMAWQKWKVDSLNKTVRGKMALKFHAALFAEMVDHPYFRYQTEFQWVMKGSRQAPVLDNVSLQYFSWGNYFKLRQELYDVTPYILLGPKIDYLLASNLTGFRRFHPAFYSAIGIEFLYTRPWILLAEAGIENDLFLSYKQYPLKARNNLLLLRLGIKREIKKKVKGCKPIRK